MKRMQLVVNAVLACLLIGWLVLARAQQVTVDDIVRRLSPVPKVRDLTCKADVTVRYVMAGLEEDEVLQPAGEVGLSWDYAVKPPSKVRLTLTSYQPAFPPWPDHFGANVGMVILLNDNKLTISEPATKKSATLDLNQPHDRQNLTARRGETGMPVVDPFVKDWLDWRAADWSQAKLVGKEMVEGIECWVLELRYPRPLKTAEPHFATATRRKVDATRWVTVKEEDCDEQGNVVSTTTYYDFQKNTDGVWVPLRSKTVVSPGKTTLAMTQRRQTNAEQVKEDVIRGRVRIRGRVIERAYQLVQGKYPLLSKVTVEDDEGNLLLRAVFRDYRVNQGLSHSLFESVK
jgi:outer membrane lipoprotein-sorting protein